MRRARLALGLALRGAAAAAALGAPVASFAHEDEEWEHDRQDPYAGEGWSASQGGIPPLEFPRSGVELRSWIPLLDFDPGTTSASDLWGYASPSGREYALIGLSLGTAFVEVTDPGDARIVALMPGPVSMWREIKTHQHYAYVVSEGGGGIQVFDLSQIDAGMVTLASTVTAGGRLTSHNVVVNAQSGRLYRAGGAGAGPPLGLRIYSLANPGLPAYLGEWNGRYCHDAQAVTWTSPPWAGVEVAFCYANDTASGGNPGIHILNVSNPAAVSVIGSINLSQPPIFSHPAHYSHQGWLSFDRGYVYFNDEVDEAALGTPTTTRIIGVSDLANPTQIGIFSNGNTARDHNLFTRGYLIFEANYRSGLRVFTALNPLAPVEFAFFDTYPDDDGAHYNGLWGVYPYLPSGTLLGSDIEKGLFVWTLSGAPVPSLSAPGILALGILLGASALFVVANHPRSGQRTREVPCRSSIASRPSWREALPWQRTGSGGRQTSSSRPPRRSS